MTIVPKSPLERLVYFQEEVDKLFHLLFDDCSISSDIEGDNYPPVDVYENENCIDFEFEIPDVNKEDLILVISNDLIIVEGTKKEKAKSGIKNYICMERIYGKFQRILKIPSIVDTRDATAEYNDGILTVTFKKIRDRRSKSKKIVIE
jgi:HSP20 family protein